MKRALMKLLRCPACEGPLAVEPFAAGPDGEEIVEGLLECRCGAAFPVTRSIPRLLRNAAELFPEFFRRHGIRLGPPTVQAVGGVEGSFERAIRKTQESFSFQWTTFHHMFEQFREHFWDYVAPATPALLKGKLGLDVGCGFGRHIYYAAATEAEMVGVDLSRAVDAAYANTRHLPNVHLVQADIYGLPFAPETFDFAYSIGVLHHLPDPQQGVARVVSLLKPDGQLFVWLYSKRRRVANFCLELARRVTKRLPHRAVKGISLVAAVFELSFLILPYRAAVRVPFLRAVAGSITPPRIKMYSAYPFEVIHADWFDRAAAPIRYYYSEPEVQNLLLRAGLAEVRTSPTGYYGWRGSGVRREGPRRDTVAAQE